jgi:hypothetical protein
MKQSGNGYKLSKFVQKIFADFIVDICPIGIRICMVTSVRHFQVTLRLKIMNYQI